MRSEEEEEILCMSRVEKEREGVEEFGVGRVEGKEFGVGRVEDDSVVMSFDFVGQ